MKCVILGCGGSNGVPQIGCDCYVCTSTNPLNKRTRVSILVETQTTRVLVDLSPDLRMQALSNNISYVDAVLITHDHSDHVAGIDDIKLLSSAQRPITAYMDQTTYNSLNQRYEYIFKQFNPLYPPRLVPNIIKQYDCFKIGDIRVFSFLQKHDYIDSLGFRFNDLVYSTDVNEIPEESYSYLKGVKHWVLDLQRYHWVPSHAFIEKVLNWVARVNPENVYLTHMSHGVEYEEIKRLMPSNIVPAHDGMIISC